MPPLLNSGRTELVGYCFAHTLAPEKEAIPKGGGCELLAGPCSTDGGPNVFWLQCDGSKGLDTVFWETRCQFDLFSYNSQVQLYIYSSTPQPFRINITSLTSLHWYDLVTFQIKISLLNRMQYIFRVYNLSPIFLAWPFVFINSLISLIIPFLVGLGLSEFLSCDPNCVFGSCLILTSTSFPPVARCHFQSRVDYIRSICKSVFVFPWIKSTFSCICIRLLHCWVWHNYLFSRGV